MIGAILAILYLGLCIIIMVTYNIVYEMCRKGYMPDIPMDYINRPKYNYVKVVRLMIVTLLMPWYLTYLAVRWLTQVEE